MTYLNLKIILPIYYREGSCLQECKGYFYSNWTVVLKRTLQSMMTSIQTGRCWKQQNEVANYSSTGSSQSKTHKGKPGNICTLSISSSTTCKSVKKNLWTDTQLGSAGQVWPEGSTLEHTERVTQSCSLLGVWHQSRLRSSMCELTSKSIT